MTKSDKAKLKTASKDLAKLAGKKSALLTERELALVELIVTFLASLGHPASKPAQRGATNRRLRPANRNRRTIIANASTRDKT